MPGPTATRLELDERRSQLVDLGERLFTTYSYSELSMSRIAREAGISKALLYHYFPSKQEYFKATLANAAQELRSATEPNPSLPPAAQLAASIDAFLRWVEEHTDAYVKLLQTANEVPEVRALIDDARDLIARRLLDGILPSGEARPPAARTVVRGWIWFMDGACLDWIRNRDISRQDLRRILMVTLLNSLRVATELPRRDTGA